MANAETDLSKPSTIVARIRRVGIIHPSRLVKVKSTTWTRLFGSYETSITIGDSTIEPTKEEINEFIRINKVSII